ncbi:hypothetical protein V4F39_07560 [Aquincola sp. MAHUQ-54]|uniref:Uncharacterized protein n=1 Tax=Aquincola agrisoli TaxID=3119538 RepID=A0AAW9QGJ1_9BURK
MAEFPAAMDLLALGYPRTPRSFWEAGRRRLQAVPPNQADQPLGMFLEHEGRRRGLVLGFSGKSAEGQHNRNLSSWFIDPSARVHALWMARELCPDACATAFTLLTPVRAVRRLFRHVPFRAVSHQAVVVWTPKVAMRARPGVRLLGRAATVEAVRDPWTRRALEDHGRLGCLVCGIEVGGSVVPLVFRARRRVRLLPVAELIYTPSVAAVVEHAGNIGRYLLQRGWPCMEFEAAEDEELPFPCTRLFRRRFARGPYTRHGIDHLYSELVYLGVD